MGGRLSSEHEPHTSSLPLPTTSQSGRSLSRSLRPLWLALRWQEYMRSVGRVGKRGGNTRITDGMTVNPRYVKAFERVAVFCEQHALSAEDYFTAIREKYQRNKRWWKPWTIALGSEAYNKAVIEHLERRTSNLAGRTTGCDAGYLQLERRYPWEYGDRELRCDVRLYHELREQYPHLTAGQFWVTFVHEFGGAFLFTCDEWQALNDLHCFLSSEQLATVEKLRHNADLAAHIRAIVTEETRRSGVGSQTCMRRTVMVRTR